MKPKKTEKHSRNIELTLAKMKGAKTKDLAKKYGITGIRVNQIVSDTKAIYPDLLIIK